MYFFYELLKKEVQERNYMEARLSERFHFENTIFVWKSIYMQKVKFVYCVKLAEFNFKVLHNLVPCGYTISKWDKNIQSKCDYCGNEETTEHMLLTCNRINVIWSNLEKVLKMNIT